MKTITITHTCDRCGYQTQDVMDRRDGKGGSVNIQWREQTDGRAWDGLCTHDDAWICQDCHKEFLRFIKGEDLDRPAHKLN